jgi:hypothetical protein
VHEYEVASHSAGAVQAQASHEASKVAGPTSWRKKKDLLLPASEDQEKKAEKVTLLLLEPRGGRDEMLLRASLSG